MTKQQFLEQHGEELIEAYIELATAIQCLPCNDDFDHIIKIDMIEMKSKLVHLCNK